MWAEEDSLGRLARSSRSSLSLEITGNCWPDVARRGLDRAEKPHSIANNNRSSIGHLGLMRSMSMRHYLSLSLPLSLSHSLPLSPFCIRDTRGVWARVTPAGPLLSFPRESAEFRFEIRREKGRLEEAEKREKGEWMDIAPQRRDHPSPFLICMPRCFSNTPL